MLFLLAFQVWGLTGLQSASLDASFWLDVRQEDVPAGISRSQWPDSLRTIWFDAQLFEDQWVTPASTAPFEAFLPLPEGGFAAFWCGESSVMSPELQQKYPGIRSFRGVGIEDSRWRVCFDWSTQGFHGLVFRPEGSYLIDPIQRGNENYLLVYERQAGQRPTNWQCAVDSIRVQNFLGGEPSPIGDVLRTYRIAIAATGEFTQYFGGTVADGLSAVNTALNRVNMVYEAELGISMQLIGNNDQIIYTDGATDPYTNSDVSAMVTQNRANLNAVIGSANYDIGHVFGTGEGGAALLAVVCDANFKGSGATGSPMPEGDPFFIDYVAHELGHQWGAEHTFNAATSGTTGACTFGNRGGSTAFEPGSGSTIMGYAGICDGENLQESTDPYFHAGSLNQIISFSRTGFGSMCGVASATGNQIPSVTAPPSRTIPAQTFFELTADGSDPDMDPLTYCWEQMDLGPPAPPDTDDGSRPIFRSFNPSASPTRTFPKLSDILNNTSSFGESLPTTDRNLTFRVTVRDQRLGGGGVNWDTLVLAVSASAGPFVVTVPNTAVTWEGGSLQTVTWAVANTNTSPVSASMVDILFSADGGLTYNLISAGQPNDGSVLISVPNIATTQARIKIKASDNYFFDVSNTDFTVNMVVLICTADYSNWLAQTEDIFQDFNGNGIVDVIDLINCIVP
ncbi:MAG: hypothetical protein H6510_10250 [Acidobacteria bacterium]|nr:hypothetical protein [Acidobacteriota bacterium]MCB9398190.1 hypothetical protein [Acidobacteriota bacterium]